MLTLARHRHQNPQLHHPSHDRHGPLTPFQLPLGEYPYFLDPTVALH